MGLEPCEDGVSRRQSVDRDILQEAQGDFHKNRSGGPGWQDSSELEIMTGGNDRMDTEAVQGFSQKQEQRK